MESPGKDATTPAGSMTAPREGSRGMKGTGKMLNAFDHVLGLFGFFRKN